MDHIGCPQCFQNKVGFSNQLINWSQRWVHLIKTARKYFLNWKRTKSGESRWQASYQIIAIQIQVFNEPSNVLLSNQDRFVHKRQKKKETKNKMADKRWKKEDKKTKFVNKFSETTLRKKSFLGHFFCLDFPLKLDSFQPFLAFFWLFGLFCCNDDCRR